MQSTLTLNNLEKSLIERLNDYAGEILTSPFPEDSLHEYIDSEVPVYNDDIIELCQNDPWLGLEEPSFTTKNALQSISANIYEYLSEKAYEWLAQNQLN